MLRITGLAGLLGLIVVMMVGLPVWGQSGEAGTDVTAAEGEVNYFDFFVSKGGYIAFVLIGLSMVTIALTIEHCLSIRRATMVPPQAAMQTKAFIEKKQYLEAIKFCAEDPSMIGYVLNAASGAATSST